MATINATADLTAISQTVVDEQPSATINSLPTPEPYTVSFFHGVKRVEGSDTTFTTTAPWKVTFGTTNVSTVLVDDRVYVIDTDRLLFGDVTNVTGGVVTVAGWYQNERVPSTTSIAPGNGSKTVINVKPVQLSYTIGATTHVPLGSFQYNVGDAITFHAYTTFPKPRYRVSTQWHMADGLVLNGSTVTHTYTSLSSHRRVVMRVTDDLGKEYFVGSQVYVMTPPPFSGDNFTTDTSSHFSTQWLTFPGPGIQGPSFDHLTPSVTAGKLHLAYNYYQDADSGVVFDDRSNHTGDITVKVRIVGYSWSGQLPRPILAIGYQGGDALALVTMLRNDGITFIGRTGDESALGNTGGWPTIVVNNYVELKRVGNVATTTLYDTDGVSVRNSMSVTIPNSNMTGVVPPTNWQTRLGAGTTGYVGIGSDGVGAGVTVGYTEFDDLTIS